MDDEPGIEPKHDDPMLGREIGGYQLLDRLGDGGMGVVYRAHDRGLKRDVALKVLAPQYQANADMRARFQREAALAANVDHPNVVPVHDGGIDETSGALFLVMQLVDGADLSALVHEDGALDVRRALRLFTQAADALHHVHSLDMVHRDIKPQNVLVRNPGSSSEWAMLTDFGIARALDSQTALTFGIIGTPDYMAPEVADFQRATPHSDQYSLGCLLYRMLAGEQLFEGLDVPKAHKDEPLPEIGDRLPNTPPHVCAAIARALDKDPSRRFPSVKAFADACALDAAPQSGKPRKLHLDLADLLSEAASEWVSLNKLTEQLNERRRRLGAEPVSRLQIEGRIELYPQLFRRRGTELRLR